MTWLMKMNMTAHRSRRGRVFRAARVIRAATCTVGTCAMGAVVDAHCRVLGVDGLSVVDASVMPNIPSANTNIPTIMIAERVASLRRHG